MRRALEVAGACCVLAALAMAAARAAEPSPAELDAEAEFADWRECYVVALSGTSAGNAETAAESAARVASEAVTILRTQHAAFRAKAQR